MRPRRDDPRGLALTRARGSRACRSLPTATRWSASSRIAKSARGEARPAYRGHDAAREARDGAREHAARGSYDAPESAPHEKVLVVDGEGRLRGRSRSRTSRSRDFPRAAGNTGASARRCDRHGARYARPRRQLSEAGVDLYSRYSHAFARRDATVERIARSSALQLVAGKRTAEPRALAMPA